MSGFPSRRGGAPRNRFVTFGLAMVVIGWLVLVADLLLSDAMLQAGRLVAVLSLKGDIATLAQLLVLTGLGLAILGGLREGFGVLNRFFDTVLQRSQAARPHDAAETVEFDDEDDDLPAHHTPAHHGPAHHTPERPAAERTPAQARNYTILPDGSVEVDTLLGTRIFASMDEARDFIR